MIELLLRILYNPQRPVLPSGVAGPPPNAVTINGEVLTINGEPLTWTE